MVYFGCKKIIRTVGYKRGIYLLLVRGTGIHSIENLLMKNLSEAISNISQHQIFVLQYTGVMMYLIPIDALASSLQI